MSGPSGWDKLSAKHKHEHEHEHESKGEYVLENDHGYDDSA